MTDERKGAPSASKFGALALCPGREKMEKGLPDQRSSDAQRGDVLHDAMYGKDVELSPDDVDLVRRMHEEEETILITVFGDDWADGTYGTREERMWSSNKTYSGKPDMLAVKDGTALIIDYKTGRIPVTPAKDNWQLRGMAVLADQKYTIDECFVAIIQPYCGSFSLYRYDRKGLSKARRQVNQLLRRVNSDTIKLVAGEKQCKYCRAKTICPALREQSSAISIADTGTLTSAQMGDVLDKAGLVEMMIKSVRARAKEVLMDAPVAINGWKLVDGTPRRKLTSTNGVYTAMTNDGLSFDAIMGAANFSVTKIERALRESKGLTAQQARDYAAEMLKDLIETSDPDPKLEKNNAN